MERDTGLALRTMEEDDFVPAANAPRAGIADFDIRDGFTLAELAYTE